MEKTTNTISTSQAMKIATEYGTSVTRTTMIIWCERYDIGCKVGGRWYIDKEALLSVLKGKLAEV